MAGSTVATGVREESVPKESWLDKWRWYERNTSKEEKTLLRKLVRLVKKSLKDVSD